MNPTSQATDPTSDPFDLDRFLRAQAPVYARALAELQQGQKRSHWMWYIFPQLAGLAFSAASRQYAIQSLDEARAYWEHPVLGARLRECGAALLQVEGRSALDILGSPDDLKLRSCATLFAQVASPDSVCHRLLQRFFDGEPDERTLDLLPRE